ncbi:MAG: hypothetical protein IJM50_07105 [Lachnospiraceae bacterium]|nr:hypothetical protein [Lachnospiraceae bacterium]
MAEIEKNLNADIENTSSEKATGTFSQLKNALDGNEMLRRYRERHGITEADQKSSDVAESQEKVEKKGLFRSAADVARKAGQKVVHTFDQNDDGKLDLQDIKDRVARNDEKRAAEKRERDRKALLPIFEGDITSPEFSLPKMIRLAEIDKKHAENEVCAGSVGHETVVDGLRMLNIYPDHMNLFDIHLVPNANSEVYYVDPFDRDKYIALEEYFKYLRLLKVHELQRIAQELGAKHFKVTYVNQQKDVSDDNKNLKVQLLEKGKGQSGNAAVQSSSEHSSHNLNRIDVMAEMEYLGHAPREPRLFYLKGDPNVESLIEARMSDNTMLHQKLRIDLLSTSGIKEKDALKIDAALAAAGVKVSGGVTNTITHQTQSEGRMSLEYEIDF